MVGLDCPRQEVWVRHTRAHLRMPLVAVGAAFEYHAGLLRKPPAWMQRRGLEWLWRFGLEPRRLWRRYLVLNPAFAIRLVGQRLGLSRPPVTSPGDRQEMDAIPAWFPIQFGQLPAALTR